jgi:hypothetical protein
MKAEINALETDLKAEMAAMETRLNQRIDSLPIDSLPPEQKLKCRETSLGSANGDRTR